MGLNAIQKKIVKSIAMTGFIILISLVIFVSSAIVILNIAFAREYVLSEINKRLRAHGSSIKIDIRGGFLPISGKLKLFDYEDPYLKFIISDLTWEMEIKNLIKRKISFKEVLAKKVTINQKVTAQHEKNHEHTKVIDFFLSFVDVTKIEIQRIEYNSTSLTVPLVYFLKGKYENTKLPALVLEIRDELGLESFHVEGRISDKGVKYLRLNAFLEREGLLGRLLGIPERMCLKFNGEGEEGFEAALELELRGIAQFHGRGSIVRRPWPYMDLTGVLQDHSGELQRFLGHCSYLVSLHIPLKDLSKIPFGLVVESPEVSLRATGEVYDLAYFHKTGFRLEIKGAEPSGVFGRLKGPVEMDGTLSGPVWDPTIMANLYMVELEGKGVILEGLKANLQWGPKRERQGHFLKISQIALHVRDLAGGFNITGHGELLFLKGRHEGLLQLKAQLNKAISEGLVLRSPTLDLKLDTMLHSGSETEVWVSGRITGIDQRLLLAKEDKPSMESSFHIVGRLEPDHRVHIPEAGVDFGPIKISGSGTFDLKGKGLSLKASLVSKEGLKAMALKDMGLGQTRLEALIAGTFDNLRLTGAFYSSLELSGGRLEGLKAGFNGSMARGVFKGGLEFSALLSGDPVTGSFKTTIGKRRVEINEISIASNYIKAGGELDLDPWTKVPRGKILCHVKDLSLFTPVLGVPVAGSCLMNVQGNPGPGGLAGSFYLSQLRLGHVAFGDGSGYFKNLDPFDLNGVIEAFFPSIAISDKKFNDVKLKLEANQSSIDFQLMQKGGVFSSTILVGKALVKSKNPWKFECNITQLDLQTKYNHLKLENDIMIHVSNDSMVFYGGKLSLNNGLISLNGSLGVNESQFYCEFSNIPILPILKDYPVEISGNLSGKMVVAGTLLKPIINLDVDLVDLKASSLPEVVPLSGVLYCFFGHGNLLTTLNIKGKGENILDLRASIPLNLSIMPFEFGFGDLSTSSYELRSNIRLEDIGLPAFLRYDIGGILSLDVNGSLKGLYRSRGRFEFVKGYFREPTHGVLFKDLLAKGSIGPDGIILEQLECRDGKGGTIKGGGAIALENKVSGSRAMQLSLEGFSVVDTRALRAKVSGDILVRHESSNFLVSGSLEVKAFNLDMDALDGKDAPELPVIEVFAREPGGRYQSSPGVGFRLPIILDLEVFFGPIITLRSKELNTIWEGEATVKGDVLHPHIKGVLRLVRGKYTLLGKAFHFVSGEIVLDGSYPPMPYIIARAEAKRADVKAIVDLKGRLDSLGVQVRSEPEMPSGEVLSRVLFGKEMGKLSPIQGLELARILAGKEKPPLGNIGGLQDKILKGVDVQISSEDPYQKAYTLKMGRHLTDKLYLELEGSTEAPDSKARLELELTPNIGLDAQVGQNSGLGIRFKWDY